MLYVSVIHRDFGRSFDAFIWAFRPHTPQEYRDYILDHPQQQFQVVTSDAALLQEMRELQAERPERGLDVVDIHTLPFW
jgi:hypothetical protein